MKPVDVFLDLSRNIDFLVIILLGFQDGQHDEKQLTNVGLERAAFLHAAFERLRSNEHIGLK